ncbi:MAG TPA: type II toxin-antitoxin system prevent-host-death family antitoxin [Spirochaetota bacterium]|nr:type II toxin-antitoxin system prevent-host-death family antitoxin [Spirochaetota bacterium]
MDFLQFTDFRNHTKDYFDKVESGKNYIIVRKGKPIAKIIPFHNHNQEWKRTINKVKLKKSTDSLKYVLEERNER